MASRTEIQLTAEQQDESVWVRDHHESENPLFPLSFRRLKRLLPNYGQ